MLVTALEPGAGCAWSRPAGSCTAGPRSASTPDPVAPTGSLVSWTEELWLPGLRRPTRAAGDRLGAVLFSRVVDGLLRPGGRGVTGARRDLGGLPRRCWGIAVVVAAAWLLGRPRSPRALRRRAVSSRMPACRSGRPVTCPAAPGSRPRLRGYRMDQVDTVLDSLEARIAEHDLEIALLRGEECPSPTPGAARSAAGTAPTPPAHRRQRQRRGRTSRPLDRVRQPAADDVPGCRTPRAAASVGPLGAAGLPPARRLGARPG